MFDQTVQVDELDARGVCEFVAERRRAQLRAEADIAHAVGQWCDLHGCENCRNGQLLNPHLPGSERARVFGADDNPEVAEFCVAELAAQLGQHPNGTVELLADVQDLRFRHPLLWARVQALRVPLWKARQIVRKTRHLPRELAQLVDARTVDPVESLAWGRFVRVLDAAIIAVDPERAEELAAAAAARRFAGLGRPDGSGAGLRTFTARTVTSEAVWFDAMCGRIAQMLQQLGDTDSADVRRSRAFGILGHPVRAVALFADYQAALDQGRIAADQEVDPWADHPAPDDPGHHPPDDPDEPFPNPEDESAAEAAEDQVDLFGGTGTRTGDEPDADADADADTDTDADAHAHADAEIDAETDADADAHTDTDTDTADIADDETSVGEADVHPAQNDAEDPDIPCPACAGAGTLDPRVAGDPTPFVKLATGLDKLDWGKLLPKVTFYVHASRESFTGGEGGVVRLEGHGALTVGQARDFFGHDTHQVTVKPVIDPDNVRPVDAYETPDWMAEIVHLLSPGDVFPYANHVGRAVDLDHLHEYLDPAHGGPPGQTRPDNLGPMIRFHHRIKTHGRWRMRVVRPGVQVWRTPQGFYFQTDPRGTHPLTDEAGQLLWDACALNPETSGAGKVRAQDIPGIVVEATTARAGPGTTDRPTHTRTPAGPDSVELEFFRILEQYEYELAPD